MKQLKTRRLSKTSPKAKTHKPKKGKGAYTRLKAVLEKIFLTPIF